MRELHGELQPGILRYPDLKLLIPVELKGQENGGVLLKPWHQSVVQTPRRTPITQGHRQRRKEEGRHPRSPSFLWSLTSGKCIPLLKSKGKKNCQPGIPGNEPYKSILREVRDRTFTHEGKCRLRYSGTGRKEPRDLKKHSRAKYPGPR